MKKVIFACIHNAGRSQMAEAFFNKYADSTKATAVSAGTQPEANVHPVVAEVMQEVGIDLSNNVPKKLAGVLLNDADYLVTMGCGEDCPYKPHLKIFEWQFDDPKNLSKEQVRKIRDHIEIQVKTFLAQNLWLS